MHVVVGDCGAWLMHRVCGHLPVATPPPPLCSRPLRRLAGEVGSLEWSLIMTRPARWGPRDAGTPVPEGGRGSSMHLGDERAVAEGRYPGAHLDHDVLLKELPLSHFVALSVQLNRGRAETRKSCHAGEPRAS